jgi:hypothetical protein
MQTDGVVFDDLLKATWGAHGLLELEELEHDELDSIRSEAPMGRSSCSG